MEFATLHSFTPFVNFIQVPVDHFPWQKKKALYTRSTVVVNIPTYNFVIILGYPMSTPIVNITGKE
jgi:hypothetical protein